MSQCDGCGESLQPRSENVKELAKAADGMQMAMRSCWNCNGAHTHLKDRDYPIHCFCCGHVYFKGERLTA